MLALTIIPWTVWDSRISDKHAYSRSVTWLTRLFHGRNLSIEDWGADREFANTASDYPRDSEIFGHHYENLIRYHGLEKHTAAPPIPTAHMESRNMSHVLYYTGGQKCVSFSAVQSTQKKTKKLHIRDRMHKASFTATMLLWTPCTESPHAHVNSLLVLAISVKKIGSLVKA